MLPQMENLKRRMTRIQPTLYMQDPCLKYIPVVDKEAFQDQINITEGQLVQIMPQKIRKFKDSFQNSGLLIDASFWGSQLIFQGFFHKVGFLNKMLFHNKYLQVIVRIGVLAASYIYTEDLKSNMQAKFKDQLYQKMANSYSLYKLSGDITKINPQIRIINDPFSYQSNLQ